MHLHSGPTAPHFIRYRYAAALFVNLLHSELSFSSDNFLFTSCKMSNGDAPARFVTPEIKDNPNGWGPNTIPAHFKDMPYQPFSKSDRLGKV